MQVARQVSEGCEDDVDEEVHAAAGDGEDAQGGELWCLLVLGGLDW